MLRSLFGYFFCMITMLTAVAVLLTSLPNISTTANGRNHLRRPVISRTVKVEVQRQRHSQVAKQEAPAKDVTPVVASAKADTKKSKHYKPRVVARQRDNYGYRNARGYAQESGYGPSGFFFR